MNGDSDRATCEHASDSGLRWVNGRAYILIRRSAPSQQSYKFPLAYVTKCSVVDILQIRQTRKNHGRWRLRERPRGNGIDKRKRLGGVKCGIHSNRIPPVTEHHVNTKTTMAWEYADEQLHESMKL